MRTKIFLFGFYFCASLAAYADENIAVQMPAVLAPNAPIAQGVASDCGVELLVGNHVFEKVSARYKSAVQIQNIDKAGADKVLRLTILSVEGVGGGGWSGRKAITVRADLWQNGQVLETTTLRRRSGGGLFGGVSGTCKIMERIAIELGEDITSWLPFALRVSQPQPVGTSADSPSSKVKSDSALATEAK